MELLTIRLTQGPVTPDVQIGSKTILATYNCKQRYQRSKLTDNKMTWFKVKNKLYMKIYVKLDATIQYFIVI